MLPPEYRDSILPPSIRARISIEAASPLGWERYVGFDGIAIGMNRFGISAPSALIYEKLGFTSGRMVKEALMLLKGDKS